MTETDHPSRDDRARSLFARRLLLFGAIVLAGVAFDLSGKVIAFRTIGPPGSPAVHVIPNIFELRTSHNRGALMGFGSNLPYSSLIFAVLSAAASIAITYWLFGAGGHRDLTLTVALALITARALGNGFDRVLFGYVRDFMFLHYEPLGLRTAIFNFADNLLVAGAAILFVISLRRVPEIDDTNNPDAPALCSAREPR